LVSIEDLLPRVLPERLRQFGRLITAAQLNSLAKAFGKLDARRASSKVSLDLLAGIG
jgi:hypothetical protein